jgi:hypothetical protein
VRLAVKDFSDRLSDLLPSLRLKWRNHHVKKPIAQRVDHVSGELGPITDMGSPAILMIQARPQNWPRLFSWVWPFARSQKGAAFIKSAGEPRHGVSFDQLYGSAVGGFTGCNVIGAHGRVTRHVAKSAESNRTRNLAWQSWERTCRPGIRACRFRRGGQGHRQFLAADRHGPQTG